MTEKTEARTPNSERMKAFEAAINMVNKNKKLNTGEDPLVRILGSTEKLNVEKISTGSAVLDSCLGGGLGRGRIIEIFGPESSGKTSIALTAVGNVQKKGGNALFIDFEHAIDPVYAKKLGVDVDRLAIAQPDTAEQGLDLVVSMVESNVVDIIVIDSIAAMVPQAEMEADMEQQTIGLQARLLSKAFRKIAGIASKSKTTIICINQLRDKIGVMYGNPETTTGGKALKFYATQRIRISRVGIVKDGKVEIGTKVKMKVVKNKIAPPFKEGETVLTFGHGINVAAEIVEDGVSRGILTRQGNTTYIETATGQLITKRSKAEAVSVIENDPVLLERLSKALVNSMESSAEPVVPEPDEDVDSDDIDD